MKASNVVFLAIIGHALAASITRVEQPNDINDVETVDQLPSQDNGVTFVSRPRGFTPKSGPSLGINKQGKGPTYSPGVNKKGNKRSSFENKETDIAIEDVETVDQLPSQDNGVTFVSRPRGFTPKSGPSLGINKQGKGPTYSPGVNKKGNKRSSFENKETDIAIEVSPEHDEDVGVVIRSKGPALGSGPGNDVNRRRNRRSMYALKDVDESDPDVHGPNVNIRNTALQSANAPSQSTSKDNGQIYAESKPKGTTPASVPSNGHYKNCQDVGKESNNKSNGVIESLGL